MELFGIIGSGDINRIEHIHSVRKRMELVYEDSAVKVLGNPDDSWYSRVDGNEYDIVIVGAIHSWRDDRGGYHATTTDLDARVVSDLIKREGLNGLDRLNGEFFAIVRDHERDCVHIATDRLGTVPAVAYRSEEMTAFTTNIQLFAADPEIDLTYDETGIAEYFAFQRTYGTKTPLANVQRIQPGSVETYEDGELTDECRYWIPRRDPKPRSFKELVDEFVDRFAEVVDERTRGDQRFGLLLSGGSDSRLLAHYLPDDTIAFHMNDSVNRETRVSKQIAQKAGLEFRFLKRHPEYYYDVLLADADQDNYTSWFHEAHSLGFEDEFEDVDVLVTGLFADILFRGYYIPKYAVRIPGPDWLVEFPMSRDITTIDELVEYRLNRVAFNRNLPPYIDIDTSLKNILKENIQLVEGGIIDHGIEYPSISELKFSYIPLTNDFSRDYFSMARLGPRWSPFLDMRLIDLQLSIPLQQMTKRNIVNRAVTKEAPYLGRIGHSDSRLNLRYPEPVHLMADQFRRLQEAVSGSSGTDDIPYATNESWPDHDALIREVDTYIDYLQSEECRNQLQALPFIDINELDRMLSQSPSHTSIYPLITLLATPISKAITDVE